MSAIEGLTGSLFLTAREQDGWDSTLFAIKHSLQWNALLCICLIAFDSPRLLYIEQCVANKVLLHIIVQSQTSRLKDKSMHEFWSPSVAPRLARSWFSHINHNNWYIWCIFKNGIFFTNQFPWTLGITFDVHGSIILSSITDDDIATAIDARLAYQYRRTYMNSRVSLIWNWRQYLN